MKHASLGVAVSAALLGMAAATTYKSGVRACGCVW